MSSHLFSGQFFSRRSASPLNWNQGPGLGARAPTSNFMTGIGRLDVLNLDLAPMPSVIHAVHLGRHGMRPAVAQLLDWLKVSAKRLV